MHLNNSLKKYLHELRMEKKQKRRLASFITAMSVFVSTGVFWQLRGIGTAMTDETPSLNGTDTAAALSAPGGSLCETNEIWESTLPELTDTLAENAALIAASQLGYTENEQNYTLGDDGCTHKNYSRYGAWFGNPYGDWNNMFTCFCLHYAGVKEADIPFGSGCWAWSLKLNEKGVLSPLNIGSPKRGDVLLFDTDLDGKADRSGIISDVAETCFITIEGQVDGAVAECRHSPDDEHIIGYVPVETPENENVSLIEFSAESESGIKVAASAELGVFPDGTEMLATDIPRDEALGKAADALGTGTDEIEAVAVDISFLFPDGVELEPTDSSAVHVEITLPEEQKLSGGEFSLIHISDSGGTEIIENAEVSENGAEFDAERFSIYVLTSNINVDVNNAFMANGQRGNNSSDNPFIIGIGETIELWYDGADYSDTNSGFWVDQPNGQIIARDTTAQTIGDYTYDGWDNKYYGNLRARWVGITEGQCTIIRKNNEGNQENFYVKVVDSPVFKVTDKGKTTETRVLFTDSIIYASSGQSFVLSVNGYNDHKLAQISGTDYDPEYISRENATYAEGNTYVKFNCLKDGLTTINVNGKTIYVAIEEWAYMKLNDGRRLRIDDALNALNGNSNKVIYAYEGEVLKFSVDGYRFHLIDIISGKNDILSMPTDSSLGSLYENGNTVVPITCEKEGTGRVKVGDTEIAIVVRHPLYVKTAIMDRDIDRVNEWLDQAYAPKESGYIMNQFEVHGTNSNGKDFGRIFPYFIYVDDEFEIYSNTDDFTNGTPHFTVEYLDFTVEPSGTWGEGSWYDKYTLNGTNAPSFFDELTPTESGQNVIAKKFKATNTGYARITLYDGSNAVRTMYVQVLPKNNKLLDHADIEIADGGKYTLTKLKRNQDGSVTKTITEYRAYVSAVNRSTLYKSSDDTTPCQFYYSEGDNLLQYDSSVTGYTSEQYHVDPSINPGEPQYEFTSKYEPYYEDGILKYRNWSNTKYYADDVNHVVFDVQLALEPSKETVYEKSGSAWVAQSTRDIVATSENTQHLDSVKFTMNHQDVIDAFNKCPNHSGLDFTVMAYSALVEFELTKELTGGDITANQFEFEVVQKEVKTIRTWLDGQTVNKSNYKTLTDNGLQLKNAYRIFYNDGETKWGEGIDYEAALNELHSSGFNSLSSASDVFNIANDDSSTDQEAVLNILKKHLSVPASVVQTDTEYQLQTDGLFLLSFESAPLDTAKNDADGVVTFNALHFEKSGTYNYIIREKCPENTDNIIYDKKELNLQIQVDEANKQFTADIISDINTFEFVNHTTFTLPSTGGGGVVPYMITGSAIIILSFAALLQRKRKEDK